MVYVYVHHMAANDSCRNRVQTTESALSILEALKALDGATISQLAAELDVAKSTVHRHLTTLDDHEYVVKEGDTYYVGLRFLTFGEYARNRKKAYRMVGPKVKELAEETEERAQFLIEEHCKGVYVFCERGSNAVHTPDSDVGKRTSLHSTSAGKAILAQLPERRVDEIIDNEGLPEFTDHTITERAALFEELDVIRERGYSLNLQENIEGVNAVGAAVVGPSGQPLGALSIAGPTYRLSGDRIHEESADLLLGMTNELEINIAYARSD